LKPSSESRIAVADVLVSHPHAADFARGVAVALARAGRLAAFFTGVALREDGWQGALARRLGKTRPVIMNRVVPGMPPGRLRSLPQVELGARFAAGVVNRLGIGVKPYDVLFGAHDEIVARLPWPKETNLIYAYEDAALRTFERAARRGIGRAWDLPLPHYLTIEELWKEEMRRWPDAVEGAALFEPERKRRRKDGELSLATKVVAASAFTARSLERLDLKVPVVVVPYAFPVDAFTARPEPPRGPFTVIAVGSHDLRKGTPYLLEAWRRAAIPDAELHLIGPMRLAPKFVSRYANSFRHWPHVPKSQLGARYAAADVLAFPTLGDGFGLVIQEAMCSGTPVITTACGGGPECITDGVDGWLTPPRDVDALVERLRHCAAHRDAVFAVGRAARKRAERWTSNELGAALLLALAS
jgi:glycosyltransferase involved in cell wall biosynthesis